MDKEQLVNDMLLGMLWETEWDVTECDIPLDITIADVSDELTAVAGQYVVTFMSGYTPSEESIDHDMFDFYARSLGYSNMGTHPLALTMGKLELFMGMDGKVYPLTT